jgi:hypothetical protein
MWPILMILHRNSYRPQQNQTDLLERKKMRTKTSQLRVDPTDPTQLFFQILTTIENEGTAEEFLSISCRPICAKGLSFYWKWCIKHLDL